MVKKIKFKIGIVLKFIAYMLAIPYAILSDISDALIKEKKLDINE